MRAVAKNIIIVWFAFLLLLGNTPMQFIHEFADHHDTVHSEERKGTVIEKPHHHCAFLSLVLPCFDNDHYTPVPHYFSFPIYKTAYIALSPSCPARSVHDASSRGPPVA